jgi:hypothetical protein
MKRLVAAAAVVGLGILLAGAGPVRAAELPADNSMITGLTAGQIGAMLTSMGIEYKESKDQEGDALFMMTLSDMKSQIYCYDADAKTGAYASIQMHAVFGSGKEQYLTKVNQWNVSRRFSRAYVDSDGDPHLEADLDLENGVTVSTAKKFIERFRRSLIVFVSKLAED